MTLQDAFNTAAEDPYEEQLIWRTDTELNCFIYLRLIDPVTCNMYEASIRQSTLRIEELLDKVITDAMMELRDSANQQTESQLHNWQVGSRQQLKQRLMRLGELQ